MAKLGILIPGVAGATASTLAAGLHRLRHHESPANGWGLITERDPVRRLDLAPLNAIVVGGWDVRPCDPCTTCFENKVFSDPALLKEVESMKAPRTFRPLVRDSDYAVMREGLKADPEPLVEGIGRLRQDIRTFRREEGLEDVVVVNLTSPPRNLPVEAWAHDGKAFEERLRADDPLITAGMGYALAAIEEGCPFVDFTPSTALLGEAIHRKAEEAGVPLAGRDGSTGQTLLKSILAHMLESRNLHLDGWYSVNLLGNHDGLVLSDPEFAQSKIEDKKEVLDAVFPGTVEHLVDIRYFKPKADCKEAWDAVEFRGWLGEPLSMKVNWLGRDSVLASPLILDLARLTAFCKAQGLSGMQVPLGLFFKHPLGTKERRFFRLQDAFLKFLAPFL
ncbi:MAG: inositol-3-phosphate synthase [Planctomycetota bacterium]|jgi:myo-inositol-1-phosphate synthase